MASFQNAYILSLSPMVHLHGYGLGLSKSSPFKLHYSNIYLNLQLVATLHLWDRGEADRSRRADANVLRTMLFLIFISVPFLNALSPGIPLPCMIDASTWELGLSLLASTF